MNDGVTISKAAAFAGVTVKTVRHYHKLGLVDEPQRDTSGYRRYGSADILQIVKVRTLASAGMPLVEIESLLDAGTEMSATAFADIEQRLNRRIADLTKQRDMLHKLADGDRVLLPDRALAILDRGPALGFSAEEIASTREGFILTKALFPESFDAYIAHIERALNNTQFVTLLRRSWEAMDWERNDPRIEALATEMADLFLANPTLLDILTSLRTDIDDRYGMISRFGVDQSPAGLQMSKLLVVKLRAAGVLIPDDQ